MTPDIRSSFTKLLATAIWAAALGSSASPADATAVTYQSGSYANCSADYEAYASNNFCEGGWWSEYRQTIRFVNTGCNSGGCNADTSEVYTDSVYAVGRKRSMVDSGHCANSYGYNVYGLGTCAC